MQEDPAVQSVVGFTGQGGGGGAGQTNTGSVYVALKPLAQRDGIDAIMTRLRRKLAVVPGARLILIPVQDIRTGGRQSSAAYQYTLQADSAAELYEWSPKLVAALEHDPVLRDVISDQQQKGLETDLVIDRATAGAARDQRLRRSTTRCTMRSASGRFPPSTARRTSITW